MRVTYWVARREDDSEAYSVRGRTKKGVLAQLKAEGARLADSGDWYCTEWGARWDTPKKVVVEYDDGFDLVVQCLTESSGWWESE